jgi:membrane protein YqaA with SNARE-associated domain
MKGIYNWLGKHANSPYGAFIFALLVFIEGFFIVPISTLLAFYCLQNRRKAFWYATIATLMSALGAIAGYYIGTFLWQTAGKNLVHFFISAEKFDYLVDQFKRYQAWTVFIVALTPMPFKALTLTAGFCKLPLLPFVFFSLIARGIRFFAIAIGITIWGEKLQYYLNEYFYYFAAAAVAFTVIMWLLIH